MLTANETEEAGLHDDIASNPLDDGVRLIYADWLDDHNNAARAAFLRASVRRDVLSVADPARAGYNRECSELLERHGEVWFGTLKRRTLAYEIEAGLVERVVLDAETFVLHQAALVREAPTAHWTIHYSGWSDLRRFASSPGFAQVRRLNVEGDYLNEGLNILTASPQARNLRTLWLSRMALGQPGIQILCLSPYLHSLRDLDLANNDLTGSAVSILASSQAFPHLERLSLSGNQLIHDSEVRALTHSRTLRRLTRLNLADTSITSEAADILASWPLLGQLRYLDVSDTQFGTTGLYRLRRAARVHRDLVLIHNSLSN